MISAFVKAVAQLGDPAFRRVLWLSSAFSAVVFAVLGGAVWWLIDWLIDWLTPDWVPGWLSGWFFDLIAWVFGILGFAVLTWGSAVLAWVLFTTLVSIFVSMFLEGIAAAVEARHYPNEEPGVDLSIASGLAAGLKLLRLALLLNLIALPVYIFIPGLNFFVFYGLNGYLLGREYFEMVALRHLDKTAALELRKRYRWRLFVAGVVVTFLFTLPIVNLVTPLIATAAMVHIFKGLKAGPRERGAALAAG